MSIATTSHSGSACKTWDGDTFMLYQYGLEPFSAGNGTVEPRVNELRISLTNTSHYLHIQRIRICSLSFIVRQSPALYKGPMMPKLHLAIPHSRSPPWCALPMFRVGFCEAHVKLIKDRLKLENNDPDHWLSTSFLNHLQILITVALGPFIDYIRPKYTALIIK